MPGMGLDFDILWHHAGVVEPTDRLSVQELYGRFCRELDDTSVLDPLNQYVHFRIENFPYLIKLEYYNKKLQRWVPAKATVVIPMLANGAFDESGYRCDKSRAKTLFQIPDILANPDAIHENIHPRVEGKVVYVRRFNRKRASVKVALVTHNRSGELVLVTSFYTTEKWLVQCAKLPPLYLK